MERDVEIKIITEEEESQRNKLGQLIKFQMMSQSSLGKFCQANWSFLSKFNTITKNLSSKLSDSKNNNKKSKKKKNKNKV